MNQNVQKPPLANIAGVLTGSTRCGEVLRKIGHDGRNLIRYWKTENRSRRDDTPPAAAAVLA